MTSQQLTRRQFVTLGGTLCTSVLAGCATEQENTQETEGEASEERPTNAQEGPQGELSTQESNLLVLFFSRTGENYNVGVIEEGNTAIIAKMIASKTGADSFELVPDEPYPESYQECCDVALDEKNRNARPALKALPDLSGCTTVFFGFPVWWGDLPMPVYTAIEALDWQGKIIAPFNTHEGSGDAGMFDTLARVCSGASVTGGLTIRGSVAQNDRVETEAEVDAWLAQLGF